MIIKWQYNGAAPFKDITSWCMTSLAITDWSAEFETIAFYNDAAWTLFRLRWL